MATTTAPPKFTAMQKRDIVNFRFRYAQKVEGSIYKISHARDLFRNPSKPHLFTGEKLAFWHDGCEDHACVIDMKNILLF